MVGGLNAVGESGEPNTDNSRKIGAAGATPTVKDKFSGGEFTDEKSNS